MNSKIKKILLFGCGIPASATEKERFFSLLRTLGCEFEVCYILLQKLFIREDDLKEIEKFGVKIINKRQADVYARSEPEIKNILKEKRFDMVLFDSIYTARFFLPLFMEFFSKVRLILHLKFSAYLSAARFLKKAEDISEVIRALDQDRFLEKEKEIPIYNYFDTVIVASEFEKKILSESVPKVTIEVFPEEKDRRKLLEIFNKTKEKVGASRDFEDELEIVEIEYSNGREFINEVNKKFNDEKLRSKKYALILPSECMNFGVGKKNFFAQFIQKLFFCMQSHPLSGIILPTSNLIIARTIKGKSPSPGEDFDFSDFLEKHYQANFGLWKELNYLDQRCFLLKNEILDKTGVLDDRFRTVEYSFLDFGFKVTQANYKIICNQEAFIYYEKTHNAEKEELELDKRLLIDKWGIEEGAALYEYQTIFSG